MDVVSPSAAPVLTPPPPPAGSEVVLRTVGLTKHYGKIRAVENLALEVHRGDVFGLLGPNGSGKTTTLRMILSLIFPTAGEIELFGGRMSDAAHRRAALRRIGAIAEQPAFYPYLSARDNLRGAATFSDLPWGADLDQRITEVLVQVGLAERANDAYKKYSLGMKQRLGIAAALLSRPELVVLDEPTNGLDPAGMVEVRDLIGRLAKGGTTVLLSSHLLHEVQQVCSRVAILKSGVLLAQGEVSAMLSTASGVLLGFASPEQLPTAAGILARAAGTDAPWLQGVQYMLPEPGAWVPPGGWLLRANAPTERAADLNALLASHGIYAAEVRSYEGNLEQFFLALTGSAAQAHTPMPGAPAAAQGGPA